MNADSQDEQTDARIAAQLRDILENTVTQLAAVAAHDEALAAFVPPRRILFFTKSASLAPLGRVWRLGVFLLDTAGTLYATGSITRAVDPRHPGYQSLSAESRREVRAAAFRGPFTSGETINYDAELIETDVTSLRSSSGPLFMRGARPMVRWSPSLGDESAREFGAYLAERVELLAHPPEGS